MRKRGPGAGAACGDEEVSFSNPGSACRRIPTSVSVFRPSCITGLVAAHSLMWFSSDLVWQCSKKRERIFFRAREILAEVREQWGDERSKQAANQKNRKINYQNQPTEIMSKITKIQWCDSTINPTMGCAGCELFPSPGKITEAIDAAVSGCGANISSRQILKELIGRHYRLIRSPEPCHRNAVTTTNIWHFRNLLRMEVKKSHGPKAANAALVTIKTLLKCYAAKLHLNRGASILHPGRNRNQGYAPTFEQVTNYEGRMMNAARWGDLIGRRNPEEPWKNGLPRMVFVSDMGDTLSSKSKIQMDFLRREVIDTATSNQGARHLWLWLTKRPENMREFAEAIGGLPANMCAMTTLTGPEALHRVDELRKVRASCRGLSIEPQWERIDPKKLKLKGIDWVIIGGESGSAETSRPFHLEWVEELGQHCRENGVAFFVKQLGRNPVHHGVPIRLADPHGGDWSEWPRQFRIREFPAFFHAYRAGKIGHALPKRGSLAAV